MFEYVMPHMFLLLKGKVIEEWMSVYKVGQSFCTKFGDLNAVFVPRWLIVSRFNATIWPGSKGRPLFTETGQNRGAGQGLSNEAWKGGAPRNLFSLQRTSGACPAMKEIFDEENERRCRHQTFEHKPAEERGSGGGCRTPPPPYTTTTLNSQLIRDVLC